MKRDEIIEWILRAIGAAEVIRNPFPHMVMKDFLPRWAFEQILDQWPSSHLFTANRTMTRWDIEMARRINALPSEQQPFWQGVMDWADVANRAISNRFAPYLGIKYAPYVGDDWAKHAQNLSLITRGAQLSCYRGVVELPPHVDHPILVNNSFLYCSEADQEEVDLGTVLYRSRGLMLPYNIDVAPRLARRALRVEKTIPYRSNLVFSYLNAPISFH